MLDGAGPAPGRGRVASSSGWGARTVALLEKEKDQLALAQKG